MAVCSLTVNVPVLSVAILVQLPKLSTAFNFLTITFLLAIFEAAIDKTIVIAIVNPSGIAETVNATTVDNISENAYPLIYKKIDIKLARIINPTLICFVNLSIFTTSGDFVSSRSITLFAIFPNSVFFPIPTTIPLARPFIIMVPAYTKSFLSNKSPVSSWLSASFVFVIDSPVSIDSSTNNSYVSINFKSAGTLSPDSSNTISPKVISSESIFFTK